MGRATVRAAVAAWFAPANVAGLSTTYAAPPKDNPGTAFNLSANGGSGAVLIVHLVDDDEIRVAVGGATSGKKIDTHMISLEIRFQSVKVDSIAAMADFDALVDALMARLRADRMLGTNGVPIFQAGEGPAGIKFQMAEPVLGKQNVLINAVIHFDAQEFLTS